MKYSALAGWVAAAMVGFFVLSGWRFRDASPDTRLVRIEQRVDTLNARFAVHLAESDTVRENLTALLSALVRVRCSEIPLVRAGEARAPLRLCGAPSPALKVSYADALSARAGPAGRPFSAAVTIDRRRHPPRLVRCRPASTST
jgi:hypothetical protein